MSPPLIPQRVQSPLGSLDRHPKAESLGSLLSQKASSCVSLLTMGHLGLSSKTLPLDVPKKNHQTLSLYSRKWNLLGFGPKSLSDSLGPCPPHHDHGKDCSFTPSSGILPFLAFMAMASSTSP